VTKTDHRRSATGCPVTTERGTRHDGERYPANCARGLQQQWNDAAQREEQQAEQKPIFADKTEIAVGVPDTGRLAHRNVERVLLN
jgi:hypothetical protein